MSSYLFSMLAIAKAICDYEWQETTLIDNKWQHRITYPMYFIFNTMKYMSFI